MRPRTSIFGNLMRARKYGNLLEVEVNVPSQLEAVVGAALSRFVSSLSWRNVGKRADMCLLKSVVALDRNADATISQIEKALRRVEEAYPFLEPISVELRVFEAGGHVPHGEVGPQLKRVSSRLSLCPPVCPMHPDQGQKVLRIDPKEAFGDGSHPSTRLALQLTDELLEGHYGSPPTARNWVLDAGCGTGVLALAAAILGGFRVLAVDLDPRAMDAARLNLRLNPQPGTTVFLAMGELSCARGPFCLVLANLVPTLHARAHRTLWPVVAPGGWLILSGFCDGHEDSILYPYFQRGAVKRACAADQAWIGVLLQKPRGATL